MKLIHDEDAQRFRLPLESGGEAYVQYGKPDEGTLDLQHTVVPADARGRGLGSELIEKVLTHAREENLRIVPSCPFVAAYVRDNPEHQALVG